MTALLALALAAAAGCPTVLASAGGASPEALARGARNLVERLTLEGAGGPTAALAAEAEVLAGAAGAGARPGELRRAADRFLARLRRHCQLASGAALPGASIAGAEDRARLQAILARPEFERARVDARALGRWLLALRRAILDLLGTAEAGRWATGARAVFFGALAAVAACGLLWALRRHGRGDHSPRSDSEAPPRPELAASPGESQGRAEAALARGQACEAVRQAFLAALADLERGGRVPLGRSLTNQEMAALLAPTFASLDAPAADIARLFAELAKTFDRTVYGGFTLALDDAAEYLRRARELRRSAVEARP